MLRKIQSGIIIDIKGHRNIRVLAFLLLKVA